MALALLFDLDGTLMDTLGLIVAAMNEAAAETRAGAPFRAEELRPMIGTPVQHQLAVLRQVSGPVADEFADRYYAHFSRLVERGLPLFPGVREAFPSLAGRSIATMSTRRRDEARHMLRVAGLEAYFRAIVGGDEVSRPKPDPDLPFLAARAMGVEPTRCVVVGDSPVDIRAGRAAGMWTVAATYGYGDPVDLRAAEPHGTISRFADLPRILDEIGLRSNRP